MHFTQLFIDLEQNTKKKNNEELTKALYVFLPFTMQSLLVTANPNRCPKYNSHAIYLI